MSRVPHIPEKNVEKFRLYQRLHAKLKTILDENKKLIEKIKEVGKDDALNNFLSVSEEEFRQNERPFSEHIVTLSRSICQSPAQHQGNLKQKCLNCVPPRCDATAEELDAKIADLKECIIEATRLNGVINEAINKSKILSNICEVIGQ